MNSFHFFEPFCPPMATKQEQHVDTRGPRPRFYPDAAWQAAEADLMAHFEKYKPSEKLTGAVVLDVIWCFPAGDKHDDGEPMVVKPDTDNLTKGLKDIMTRLGWWNDDAQVFREVTTKIWSAVPGIRVDIEEVAIR